MLPLILLVPLLLAIALISITKNHHMIKYIAIAASLVSLALYALVSSGTATISWFITSGYSFAITTMVTPLNSLLMLIVLMIAPLILVYSVGFMDVQSEQKRFYIEMLGFESAMLTFAMAGSFILIFIAWEYLSLTSYLLIGFWYQREKATMAALKAISIILIGDIALLAAILLFWSAAKSFNFTNVIAAVQNPYSTYSYVAAILLIVAIFTKSAQFPFQEWLVDAMEGPTPVSAFLHSSTMVKAGVFAAIILFPIFTATNITNMFIIFGAITAVISTLNAMRETHIKRIIAYSTIQELSLMLVAIGANALLAAIYFFFVQSFYKALLFFSAGSMMKATGKEDIREVSGLRQNKLILLTTLVGVLSAAGLVPLSGFFSNSALDVSLSNNLPIYILLSAISLATSFYIFRWFFLPAREPESEGVKINYKILPSPMLYAMLIMAVLALGSAITFIYIPTFLNDGSLTYISFASIAPTTIDAAIETALVLLGLIVAFILYYRKTPHVKEVRMRFLYTRPLFATIYKYAALFFLALAETFTIFDSYISESFDSIGMFFSSFSSRIKYVSSGDINTYVAIFSIGLIALFAFLYLIISI